MLRSNPNFSQYTTCVHVQVVFPEYWRVADNTIPAANKDALVDLAAILSRFERLSDLTLAVEGSYKDSDQFVSEVCDYISSQFRQVSYLGFKVQEERKIPSECNGVTLSICPSSASELSSDMSDTMSDYLSETISNGPAEGLSDDYRSLHSMASIRRSLLQTNMTELTAKSITNSNQVVPAIQTEYRKEATTIIPAPIQGEETILFPGERAGIVLRQKKVACLPLSILVNLKTQGRHDEEHHRGADGCIPDSEPVNLQGRELNGDSEAGRDVYDNEVDEDCGENEACDTTALNDCQILEAERGEEQAETMNLEPTVVPDSKPRDDAATISGAELSTLEGADSPLDGILTAQASSTENISSGPFEETSTFLQTHSPYGKTNEQLVEKTEPAQEASPYVGPASDGANTGEGSVAESPESMQFTLVVNKKNRRKIGENKSDPPTFPTETLETKTYATDEKADKPQVRIALAPLPVFSEKKYDSWADELDEEDFSTLETQNYRATTPEPPKAEPPNLQRRIQPWRRSSDREYIIENFRNPADRPSASSLSNWRRKSTPTAERQWQPRTSGNPVQNFTVATGSKATEADTKLSNDEVLPSGSQDAASNKAESSKSQQLS